MLLNCSKLAVLAVLATPFTSAQLFPACITSAMNSGSVSMPASCGLDLGCICRDSSFVASLVPAAKKSCSDPDLASALTSAQNLCAMNGVTLNIDASALTASTSIPSPVVSSTSTTSLAPPIAYANTGAPVQASTSVFAASSVKTSSTFAASGAATGAATLSTIASVPSQAGTIPSVVSQLGDGQPLAPTGKYNISLSTSATSTPFTTITPFTGSASKCGLQHLSLGMFLVACGVFFAL